jgi:hypothetical protein
VEINENAPAVASSEIEVAAPPEVVWDVIADFERWPSWNPDVKSLSITGPVAEAERRSQGSRRRTESTRAERLPPEE